MKIVDRKTFLDLPGNTLYMKFTPQIFDELEIKMDTWSNDYLVDYPLSFIEGDRNGIANIDLGSEFRFETICGRDGDFDEDQLFAVFDNEDINTLIDRLKLCLK